MRFSELAKRFPEATHFCYPEAPIRSFKYQPHSPSEGISGLYVEQPNGDLKRVWPEPEEWRELPEWHVWLLLGSHHSEVCFRPSPQVRFIAGGRYALLCSEIPTLEEFARLLKDGAK
jgi:hypothetical protein